jgi:Protein of unknown function (DUF3828)
MKQIMDLLRPLLCLIFFIPINAYAGCTDYTSGQIPDHPRVILCYKGKCDDTTLDIMCGNAFRSNVQYANGLTVYLKEGKNQTPEFTNTLGKKMSAKDWTCKNVGVTSPVAVDACLIFHPLRPVDPPTASTGTERRVDSPPDAAQKPSDPAGIVSTAIKMDRQNTPLFDEGPKGRMKEFFTKDFMAAWDAAFANNKGQPFMDGDPISGFQTVKSLTLKNLKVQSTTDIEARVTATVLVQSDRSGDENLKFILKREAGSWKIDDISSPVEPSLHAYLEKSIH